MRSVNSLSLKIVLVLAVGLASGSALGAVYFVVPPDPDLDDLDHREFYTWGINTPWEPVQGNLYENAVGATLTFKSIRNHDTASNVLYVHLLDDGLLGIDSGYDWEDSNDQFEGQGVVLEIYHDLPATPQDLVYTFSDDEVIALNDYAQDGRFVLAFDPDCHFYNCGVELKICTEIVPEPAALSMLTLVGVFVLLRRRRA